MCECPLRSYSLVSAFAFLLWEVAITTVEEISHMWMTRWAPLKPIYFFTRYYSVLVLLILTVGSLSCKQWILLQGISAMLLELPVELLLILRIRATYSGSRFVSRYLFAPLALQVIIMTISLGLSAPKIMSPVGCIQAEIPDELVVYSIASLVFESLLFLFTIIKFCNAVKEGWGKTALIAIIFRDSVWVFAAVFLVTLINTVLFTSGSASIAALGFPWILAVLGAAGPRLMLNVRTTYRRTMSGSMQGDVPSIPIAFAVYSPLVSEPEDSLFDKTQDRTDRKVFDDWPRNGAKERLIVPILRDPLLRR